MEITTGNPSDTTLDWLYVRHKGEEIPWQVATYSRSMLSDVSQMFTNINKFMASLPMETQDTLWACYNQIMEIMEGVSDPMRLHSQVQSQVRKMYELISFDDLKKWVMVYGHIDIPPDLKQDYSGITSEVEQDLTYPREDYYDLAVFSIMTKLMVPIFGEYIQRMGKDVVGTRFKEHYAFSLLARTHVIEQPAFHRLHRYVEAKALNERRKNPAEYRRNSAIFKGLGTEELPDWLLSRTIVRRVAIHEERGGVNIVAKVFGYIDQQIKALDKNFGERVADKPLFNGKTEEDNISVAENYKVKEEISAGDLSVLSIYTEEMFDMAGRVDPNFDRTKIELCEKACLAHQYLEVCEHHITITQWVLSKAISPRGIPFLNKQALLKAIAVTQGLLWHWGFTEIALLMLAEPSEEVSQAASKPTTRLGKRHTDRFYELYPHYQQVSKSAHNLRNVNVACKAIDSLSANIIQHDWILHGPEELKIDFGYRANTRMHVISAEIRQQLGDLVLKIQHVKNADVLETA